MISTQAPRRRAGQRIASALWGVLVMGSGAMMAIAMSGTSIDLELAAIIALGSVGVWLLLSAALSTLGRSREVREATAPVVETEYVAPAESDSVDDAAPPEDMTAEPDSADDAAPPEDMAAEPDSADDAEDSATRA